ncbi:MAG: TonB-dependent receptor, partial [bacterium]
AVVRNEQEEALKLAAKAVRLAPGSATPYVARSYAEQSAFEIEPARESLEKAAELAPEDALVWARLAELELSLGDLDASLEAAQKAKQLDPGLSRTQSVLGFAYLTRIEVDRATSAFERALVLDPADPLPRLGLGLAKIRDGDLDEGTREIETAASLDPNNSLVRSYLGKAYFEQKRGGLASTEFEQARLLDPKDPTPWFYGAIQKQTTNRPVEALHDLQKAIDLNDNRAVYRSKLLLDEDLAARGAALGRIYRELGFEQLGLVEGWKSLSTDPGDYTAHRLLSDSYSALPRHAIARVSELLQSQLLQPINVTPVQPQLAESDSFLLGGLGAAEPSLNEFNPLFQRNGFSLLASGLVGSQHTYSDELVHSGIWNNLSYSLGQLHYESDGFRSNNDVDTNVYNVYLQGRITPSFSVQGEFRHRDAEEGDLTFRFEPTERQLERQLTQRRSLDLNNYRLGFNVKPLPGSTVLASLIYQDGKVEIATPGNVTTLRPDGAGAELQYLFDSPVVDVVAGGGYFDVDIELEPSGDIIDRRNYNAYMYSYLHFPKDFTWTLGVGYDALDDTQLGTVNSAKPKIGMLWNPFAGTTVRLGAFRAVSRALFATQTIEPTNIAGFNQFFDDPNGTESVRYAAGIDQRFTQDVTGGFEFSERDLDIPVGGQSTILNREETLHRGYVHWSPSSRWAVALEYLRDDFENEESLLGGPLDTTTHLAPLRISYFHPNGFFARLGVSFIAQEVGDAQRASPLKDDGEAAVVVDTGLGYR